MEQLEIISKRGEIGENYNIGSGINLSNINLIKIIIKIMKKKSNNKAIIHFVKDRPGHDLRYAINSLKIRKKFKWKPKIKLTDGLLSTIDWYLLNKNYFKNLKGNKHKLRLGLKI